jgi:putrescine transport system ATP-binding protein
MAYLEARQLVKEFGDVVAVDDVSLTINKGEIFALLGSSGCGKSTLLRMFAGFEKPTNGAVWLHGIDIASFPPYERPINMMFQSYALFPHLTVWDNIAFGLKREGMPNPQIRERVDEMLTLVRLQKHRDRKPHQLSGGQQQRVALARSLAKKPELLLLDEPLGALDKKLRQQTQFELVNILEAVGVTCVMVTHDQEEAMTMASRIAVMSHGKVLQVGTPKEVYESPNCRFVADFIGNINIFDGVVSGIEADHCRVKTDMGEMVATLIPDLNIGATIALGVRPEKIRISKTQDVAAQNLFTGTVKEIAYFGSYSTYIVALAGGKTVKITTGNEAGQGSAADVTQLAITWGDTVFFSWLESAPVVLTA